MRKLPGFGIESILVLGNEVKNLYMWGFLNFFGDFLSLDPLIRKFICDASLERRF